MNSQIDNGKMDLLNHIADPLEAFEMYKEANKTLKVEDSSVHIFKGAHETIRKHNQEFSQGVHAFQLGHNIFSHIDPAEFSRTRKGLNTKSSNKKAQSSSGGLCCFGSSGDKNKSVGSHVKSQATPSRIDWRQKGAVCPIADQGQRGTCYAFSAVAAIESHWFLKTGKLVKLSEENAIDGSSPAYGNSGDNGGWPDRVFDYVIANKGIEGETTYPYGTRAGKDRYDAKNKKAVITSYVDIPREDEPSLLNAVGTVGPVCVCFDASQPSGIYQDKNVSKHTDHAVVAVGYGSENDTNYWIIRNSWGPSWGENGYFKLYRDGQGYGGVTQTSSYPVC